MISKELLKNIMPTYDYMYVDELNIYELAHKCKEWAYKTHNKIISSEVSVEDWVSVVAHFYGNLQVHIEESFRGETEPEAIFKACQWILDKEVK